MIPLEFHKFNYQYINVDLEDGKFKLPSLLVNYYVNNGSDIIIFDKESCQIMDLIPFDHDGDVNDIDYVYEFKPSSLHEIPEWTAKLLSRFHWTWYDELKDYLESEEFKKLNKVLNNDQRKRMTLHPPMKDIYKAFSTSLDDIRVVIIGQAPYANAKHANGWAFASKDESTPASLSMFEGAIGCRLNHSLTGWIKQGVLLMNSALTVGPNSNINYFEEWQPFIREIIRVLNQKDYLCYILMGGIAQKWSNSIISTHGIINVEHPAAAAHEVRVWKHDDVFEKANALLTNQRLLSIQWKLS